MIRLLGFLLGSAASIGLILLVLGVPDVNFSSRTIDVGDSESISQTVETAKKELARAADKVLEGVPDVVAEIEPPVIDSPQESEVIHQETGIPDATIVAPAPTAVADTVLDDTNVQQEIRWHSFWNPFRSEIAANGFVSQLEKVTGLDYRVVKIRAGVYEVTFAYESDSERKTKLAQISTATGLDLPET